jgi:aminoglycoside phosphotransferase (APT) family kinase protein
MKRIGAGREAEVFEWSDGTVIKLYRPGFPGHHSEVAAMSTLAGLGVAPRLIEVVEHEGRVGLVMERVEGADLLTLLQRGAWRLPALARTFASAHLDIHAVPAATDLPRQRDVLRARVGDADLPSSLRAHVLRLLDKLPDGDCLCHGDFNPGNVMISGSRGKGQKVAVIDWVNANRGRPVADYARTLLILRTARPLAATPLMTRLLIRTGRSALARAYERAYAARAPEPVANLEAWLTVQAAARLTEGRHDVDRIRLLAIIARHTRANP